jgi:hypothetical protein
MVLLRHWSIVNRQRNPEKPPEPAFRGEVYGHPKYEDGDTVKTSRPLVRVDDHVITRSGTCYRLGEADENYERHYPDARARVLEEIPTIEEYLERFLDEFDPPAAVVH